MHVEKNVAAAIFKTFSNCKGTKSDSPSVRHAMEDLELYGMYDMWPVKAGLTSKGKQKYSYPETNWIWSTEQYDQVIDLITSIKTPTGYGSNFYNKFNKRKIIGMKTHDYHNLLHHILPIVVRGTLTEGIRDIVYRLGKIFRWLCQKEINICDISSKEEEAAEVLCLMEIHLPPTLYDIQFHLIFHLVQEVRLAGPVTARWMFFFGTIYERIKGLGSSTRSSRGING